MSEPPATVPEADPAHAGPRRQPSQTGVYALVTALVVLIVARPYLVAALADRPAVATWLTVFVSICLQALPFLVMGVVLSAAIAAWLSPTLLTKALPRNKYLAVPVAGLSGMVVPGCECASVPIAGALVSRGISPSAALTFLLASPAINPVVLVSTAVAFPGQPVVVLARFVASLATAVIVGWIWIALRKDSLVKLPSTGHDHGGPLDTFVGTARHDFLHAGGFLAIGASVAATINVLVPTSVIDSLAGSLLVSILVLAVLAVVVAICSEADAFVAASLSAFPLTARLAFMVVGPVLDVKLISMQIGTFGRAFTAIFAPITFVTAVTIATVVGTILL